MDDTELRKWLLSLARDLLHHREDVYRAFEHELNHTVAGVVLIASVRQSIPFGHWLGERRDSFGSLEFIDKLLRTVVEQWLRTNAHRWDGKPDGPAPLPIVAEGESTEQRRARRYQQCLAAGLTLPADDYGALPRGIGRLAKEEGITRQAYAEDVKAHINHLKRKNGR